MPNRCQIDTQLATRLLGAHLEVKLDPYMGVQFA